MPLVVRRVRWNAAFFPVGSQLTISHLSGPSWGPPYLPHILTVVTPDRYQVELHIRSVGRLESLTEEEVEAEETNSSEDERRGVVARAVVVRRQREQGAQTPFWRIVENTRSFSTQAAAETREQSTQTPSRWADIVSL